MNEPTTNVLARLGTVKKSGKGWVALCPAHEDRNPSLSIAEGDRGGVRLNCHRGCTREDILAAIALTPNEVAVTDRTDDGMWTPAGPAIDVYDYVDEEGRLLFQVCRTADKQFRQRRPDPLAKSGWAWRLDDVRRVLFRLPRVLTAVSEGRRVLITEGERDVRAAERAGEVATCNPGGAGKWRQEYNSVLTDAHVVVVADRDTPGQAHARTVAESLREVAASVTVCEAKVGKDLADHLAAGLAVDDLEVTQYPDGSEAPTDLAPDVHEFLAEVDVWDWCVPGLLERREKLMVTGGEGSGKSTWCRQLAVCVAAGLHPFTMNPTESRRVLVVDCENPRTQTRRELRPLVSAADWAGHPVPSGQLRLIVRGEGLDLTQADDAAWLTERVTAHQPDVLILGPLYQLHAGDPNEERPARAVGQAITRACASTGSAVVIEAHAGHGQPGKRRDMRPTGTSYWRRWVSYGYGLSPVDDSSSMWFQSWRGDRDVRDWPDRLDRGKPWPWQGVYLNGAPKAWPTTDQEESA